MSESLLLRQLRKHSPLLADRLPVYARLMRLERPIGTWLLLWPTLWALYIAGNGNPAGRVLLVFIAGTVLMRSAGCVINDFADRHVDGAVERTKGRPFAKGEVRSKEALLLFAGLVGCSALLLLLLNRATFWWSFGALALATTYPFMKRYTYLPQVVLGAAFAWAIPMAFAAQDAEVGRSAWLLYAGALCWTVAYDTFYAMADREDDLKAGVKSTAILFGDMDLLMIGSLQALFLFALWLLGKQLALGWPWAVSLMAAAGLFAWEHWWAQKRDPQRCLEAFLHNHWVGATLFGGLFVSYLLK